MREIAAAPSCRFSGKDWQLPTGGWQWRGKVRQKRLLHHRGRCRRSIVDCEPKANPLIIKSQMQTLSTYSSRISTDIPLYEAPGVSFDQYLEDKPRVFKAIFPDKRRSEQLSECKSRGMEYPSGVPRDITSVLELDIIRWELQGLDDLLQPSEFSLGVKGALYPDRRGPRTRLKGQLQMSISFVLPPALAFVPEGIRRDVAEAVLRRLVENMKGKVNGSLVADYSKFKRENLKTLV